MNNSQESPSIGFYATLGGLFAATTIGVNAFTYVAMGAAELIERAPVANIEARVEETGVWNMLNTKGETAYAKVTLADGSQMTLTDSPRVLEGKFVSNKIVPKLEEGETYNFRTVDSLFGDVVIDAKQRTM